MEEKEVYKKLFIATFIAVAFVYAIEMMTLDQIYSFGPLIYLAYAARLLFVEPNEVSPRNRYTIYSGLWLAAFFVVQKVSQSTQPVVMVVVALGLPWFYEYLKKRKQKKDAAILDAASK